MSRSTGIPFIQHAWKLLILAGIALLLSFPAYSQNTKGDIPVNNKGKVRETRFKTRHKQGDRAKTKDVAGRRIRNNRSSAERARNIYQQPKAAKARRTPGKEQAGKPIGPGINSQPRDNQRAWKGNAGRINARSATSQSRNIYPQNWRYSRNIASKPKNVEGDPGKKRRIVPRSASSSYIARRSINPVARFHRKTRKTEQAHVRDIAGKPLRAKNYQTPRPEIISPTYKPYYGRSKRIGDKPYRGPAAGRHITATKPKPKAWQGDIAGRNIKGSPKPKFGDKRSHRTIRGGGYKSATKPSERRAQAPLAGRAPGIGADKIGNFQGTIKGKRPLKGGGTRSGQLWNNKGMPLSGRAPGRGAERIGNFQGTLKARRPEKGGGSRSGILWNNKEQPLPGRVPGKGAFSIGKYQGSMKARKPLQGGGSRSGELWNNKGVPIPVKQPGLVMIPVVRYQGDLKARKQKKGGGGSISGKLWNNKETPIPTKVPPEEARKAAGYPGNIRTFEKSPGFSDQGEEFSGYIKLARFKRNYLKNPNSSDESLKKARPHKTTYKVDDLQVKVKQYDYIKNKSSNEEALKVREPGRAFVKSTDYQGNIKMQKYELFAKRGLHPDAQFVKTNKNNVADERDLLTNVKLLWSKLFKKNDTIPDHVKEKERKPRYDKREEGLWYE